MTWVQTLAELTNSEGGKLFPDLFFVCSGCRGTGISKINLDMGKAETMPCNMFKCDKGLRRKDKERMMGVLVRIYRELYLIGKASMLEDAKWTFIDEEPEDYIAKLICMRVALINYTGKDGSTT